jgi:hypothetical protein
MNLIRQIICLTIILHTASISQVHIFFETGRILLENRKIKKIISFAENQPEAIQISSIFSKNQSQELINQTDPKPYFEFVLNRSLITARDKIWQYKTHSIRKMANGGQEVKLIFEGKKNPVNGLEIVLYQQIFPNTTLVREQIILQTGRETPFYLNKLKGKLHFIFPQYSLMGDSSIISREIRIASWANELIPINPDSYNDERFTRSKEDDHNLAQCHMFHPQINLFELSQNETLTTKGPINIVSTPNFSWISAYEHASQDNLRGLFNEEGPPVGIALRDGLQGIRGYFDFPVSEKDFQFLGITQQLQHANLDIFIEILRGGYLENEQIDSQHPYASVWTASAFHSGNSIENSKEIIRDYLWRCICEKSASRQPEFYYNTWGMQRYWGSRGKDLRAIFTEEKILQEIKYAAELGVDIFVLDDGWEQAQGVWIAHRERLPTGLSPIKDELDKYGIKMGVWFSPMGIDKNSERYKKHPEWVIVDSKNQPIQAQWDHPAFDFVSDFYTLFIDDCKRLIDLGVRFFKWDAINTFYSSLPNLYHGDQSYSCQERRERYEYLLPIYVTRAMKELTDYEPELIIEIDLTEARRVMAGLAVLSQGKYFWMNNGASSYNDYTVYRAKSMRTIVNQFAGIIPLELFTYANYPHPQGRAQRYNINTSLISGHGFWGALELMKSEEREFVGKMVSKSKRLLPYLTEVKPEITGRVGGSPEIYTLVNKEAVAGQVIAFSGQALNYKHKLKINTNRLLAVLNHAYQVSGEQLLLPFDFPMPDATREAFLMPNLGLDISIVSSSSWLDDVKLTDQPQLVYVCGAPGKQKILWHKNYGLPEISPQKGVDFQIEESEESNFYILFIESKEAGSEITISS